MSYVDRPDTDDAAFEEAVSMVMDSDECSEREAVIKVQIMLTDESGSYDAVLARLGGEA